jgi:hypothetical protein
VFSDFSLKFSHYTVLEAKCVGNWKMEILWWAHHPVRENFRIFHSIGPGHWVWDPLTPLNDTPEEGVRIRVKKRRNEEGVVCVPCPSKVVGEREEADVPEAVVDRERAEPRCNMLSLSQG